ncbi:MAG: hypothetical protein WCA49_05620 [Candidatus Sulfotelmatobacter sp.]
MPYRYAATTSVLPLSVVERLNLKEEYTSQWVIWGSGQQTNELKVHVNLVIQSQPVNELWVLTCPKKYGLIGRDVLNRLFLTCDGPGEGFWIAKEWL